MKIYLVGGLTPSVAVLYQSTGTEIVSLRARIDHRCLLSIGDRVAVTDGGAVLHVETWEPALGVGSHPTTGPHAPVRLWPAMQYQIEILQSTNPKGTR